jgi:hypothetical protein
MADINSEMLRMMKSMQDVVSAQHRFIDAQTQATKSSEYRTSKERAAAAEVEEYTQSIIKGRKLNAKQEELYNKVRIAKEKELDAQNKLLAQIKEREEIEKKLGKSHPDTIKAQERETSFQNIHSRALSKTGEEAGKLERSFKGLVGGIDIAGFALRFFGQMLVNSAVLAKEQMVANQGAIEGTDYFTAMMTQQGEAFQRGINPVEMGKMLAANRQLVNAMGGTTNTMEAYQGSLLSFYTMTGNIGEANKMLLETMTSLAQKGIKPTSAAIDDYRKDVQLLSLQTGMGAEAISQLYSSVSDDVDSISLLRAARDGERESILKNQRAMISNSIAQGMSAKQAEEAAKMLNKMVAAKPLERIKQAAKMRAIGGALGIAGSEEASQGVLAGKNATAEQLQSIQTFQTNVTNAVDQSAQQGLGYELAVSQLVDKLDMGTQYGAGSAFSTTLTTVMEKNTKDVEAMYAIAADSIVGKTAFAADKIIEQTKQILNGTMVLNGIFTGVDSILKFLNGENASNWIYEGFVKSMPNFSKVFVDGLGVLSDGIIGAVQQVLGIITSALGNVTKWIPGVGEGLLNFAQSQFDAQEQRDNQIAATIKSYLGVGDPTSIVGSMSSSDPVSGVAKPAGNKGASKQRTSDTDATKRSEAVVDATTITASGIQTQIKKMDDSAALMKMLVDNSQKSVELAEKQLVALTLTDKEKADGKTSGNLRRDNKFAAQYGYV